MVNNRPNSTPEHSNKPKQSSRILDMTTNIESKTQYYNLNFTPVPTRLDKKGR